MAHTIPTGALASRHRQNIGEQATGLEGCYDPERTGAADICNLYSVTKGQQAIRELYRAMHDRTGNMPPLPGVFPDYAAPIVRNTPDGRELTMARWGMPSPRVRAPRAGRPIRA